MTLKDWLTISIAAYGAILSTMVAVNIFITARRKIKVILEIQQTPIQGRTTFLERPILSLWITNTGHRPVTITKVILATHNYDSLGRFLASKLLPNFLNTKFVPVVSDLDSEVKLPCTLGDGAVVKIVLPDKVKNLYEDQFIRRVRFNTWVIDGEGNIYKKHKTRIYEELENGYRRYRSF